MIIDNLNNSALYESLNPRFKKAFDYLKSLDFKNLEAGKTVLVEDELIVMVNDSALKPIEKARLEIHRDFIDIQVPVSKNEGYGWKAIDDLNDESEPFNTEKDCQHFNDKYETVFSLEPGSFAIFFPADGHAPCIGEGEIRKIIVKVRV